LALNRSTPEAGLFDGEQVNPDVPRPLAPWRQDLQRYGGARALLREQSLWAVLWHRVGHAVLNGGAPRPVKQLAMLPWWLVFRLIETVTGISLPPSVTIGGGLRIWHFGGVFVHPAARIGARCTLRQGVTIGNRHGGDDVPVIGDDVEFGAYAQVLGHVQIGDRARIGAMSVVLQDVPADASAVGAPARVIARSLSESRA